MSILAVGTRLVPSEKTTVNKMKTIARLFYLLINADNYIDPKELEMGAKMADFEGFDLNDFQKEVEEASKIESSELFETCIQGLRKMTLNEQTRYLAWMCLIANADGFMDSSEWALIYRIYHKELSLDRQAILDTQVELNKRTKKSLLV